MIASTTLEPGGDRDRGADPATTRTALAVFVAVVVGALVLWVLAGRHEWFVADEWSFLAGRSASSMHDLFAPHNEHWSTLPILEYRLLYRLFGARTYLPSLTMVVVAHLAVAALLRWTMRRAGVDPWLATAGAALFALFGSGWNDIVVAFQTGFNGALAAALVQVMLVDHAGRDRRRYGLALLVGLVGLMCSGVGVIGVVAAGVTAWWRRGPKAALAHCAPLAAVYLVWLATVGDDAYQRSAGVGDTLWWAVRQLGATLWALGWVPGAGIVLGLVVLAGIVVAVRVDGRTELLAAPVSLALAAVVFAVTTGRGRATGPEFSDQGPSASRYLYITAALLLPLVVLSLDRLRRRFDVPLLLLVALLVIGIPGNIGAGWSGAEDQSTVGADYRRQFPQLAVLPAGRQVPPDTRIGLPFVDPSVTFGWLHGARQDGKLPALGRIDRPRAAAATAALVFQPVAPTGLADCQPFGASVRTMRRGEVLRLRGPSKLRYEPPERRFRGTTTFGTPGGPSAWRLRVDSVRLHVGGGAEVCSKP